MRVIVQRVSKANVTVDDNVTGSIGNGLMLLVGVTHDDTEADARWTADKIANLRIFEDEDDKLNLSVKDKGGSVLSISQFTVYGDCKKGRRPNFMAAAKPDHADHLYEMMNRILRDEHGLTVETGVFGAMMDVELVNHGPVTLIVESKQS
ncbi:D-aminoacyl-tRNA deacylase [Salisediminibacterium selenitireducens]|uniref:D-aminoacyl-tRNA deacylase n=1 Tax=Bacillus selenitireducens (strain ATCC 700615 / DSM 15326 / MLS10) TaxID=439292 RepID=D6XWY4_BACIE|nr:D-aminoacyl-tRNA deacylase [Salisediminibacterium selenitireducens]ADH99960.1 D-tyrosyl-tRNA(Tyr) deacylase [[Bacillus] selenitireducens MLS10]